MFWNYTGSSTHTLKPALSGSGLIILYIDNADHSQRLLMHRVDLLGLLFFLKSFLL